jgi:predicted membrane channel-forming protein YqfA (hemolysin III family)
VPDVCAEPKEYVQTVNVTKCQLRLKTPHFVHPHYELGDILANAITHGIGAGLAIAGMVWLIVASTRGAARLIESCAIFSG